MPSYKEHVLAAIIMVFPFFQDVFYIALAVIGASMIDMDHHVNQKNITIVGLLGIILALILYIIHLPYLVGILIAVMALLFYLSEHRGFMHSLLGIIFISACVGFFVLGAYTIMTDYGISLKISLIVISLILGIVILNKKLVPIYAFIIILALLFTSNHAFNAYYVFIALLIGAISHIILDLFTKAGVELLSPITTQKFHKLAGFTLLGLYLGAVIISVVMYGNHFMWF
ncbi:MAG: metal-dependent hydrolase [Methanobacterium sp. ERen5]|nr:MAG: metal-dependent hydrolase [Methanobacterium sp. ERen5]